MEFKDFLIKLFTQMSTGNFTVKVECADNKIFDADVIGYSEEYMTVKVRFHSDKLTKPGIKKVPTYGFGFGTDDNDYILEQVQVPVKEENIWFENIKI
jgi:hypothetical protein